MPASASPVGAERDRFAAMITRDFAALDTLLAGDLAYTHTTGVVETKAQFLESLRTGRITYLSIAPSDVQVHQFADSAAMLSGRSHMHLRGVNGDLEFDIRFIDVLVRRGNRWVTVCWQSTRIQ
jgi:acyl-coenzyme A thioesterase PaaI-like protein